MLCSFLTATSITEKKAIAAITNSKPTLLSTIFQLFLLPNPAPTVSLSLKIKTIRQVICIRGI
jgi:hypothetical protein